MAFNYQKSTTYWLSQSAKAFRTRSANHLAAVGLHPGQETIMRALHKQDGMTMTELSSALGVQPPTVTKMVSRLAAQNLMRRVVEESDGRRARVFLTEDGRNCAAGIDQALKDIEREALAGLDEKDRRRLRKLLRQVERNLSAVVEDERAKSARAARKAQGVPPEIAIPARSAKSKAAAKSGKPAAARKGGKATRGSGKQK